jgi:hypothetical protein
MHHAVCLISILLFISWILPLGIFIKPSQEKMACNGRRAICMCSHMRVSKAQQNPLENSVSVKGAHGSQKESSSGGGAHHYLCISPQLSQGLHLATSLTQQYLRFQDPFYKMIEHVPNV